MPTALCKNRGGAPYGDAILAAFALGAFSYSIAKEKAKYVEPLEPRQAYHERYMEYFALYQKLYQHIKQDYKELAVLREKTL